MRGPAVALTGVFARGRSEGTRLLTDEVDATLGGRAIPATERRPLLLTLYVALGSCGESSDEYR